MIKRAKHVDCVERVVIFSEALRGGSQRQIARLLGPAPSTICRELARARSAARVTVGVAVGAEPVNGAGAALAGFSRQKKRLPLGLRKSMTCARGSAIACHPELARRLKIDIWLCHPHQSAGKQSGGCWISRSDMGLSCAGLPTLV